MFDDRSNRPRTQYLIGALITILFLTVYHPAAAAPDDNNAAEAERYISPPDDVPDVAVAVASDGAAEVEEEISPPDDAPVEAAVAEYDATDTDTEGSISPPAAWEEYEQYYPGERIGACNLQEWAARRISLGTLEIGDLTSLDLPQRSTEWLFSLHPTLQTRIDNGQKPVRKDYRQLTSEERERLVSAFWQLQASYPEESNNGDATDDNTKDIEMDIGRNDAEDIETDIARNAEAKRDTKDAKLESQTLDAKKVVRQKKLRKLIKQKKMIRQLKQKKQTRRKAMKRRGKQGQDEGPQQDIIIKKTKRQADAEREDEEDTDDNSDGLDDSNLSEYQIILKLHAATLSPSSTRSGAGQFGWHREYILRLEEALRRHEPGVVLPYWDVTLESRLSDVKASAIWSEKLWGDCSGNEEDGQPSEVKTGPFANWPTLPTCTNGDNTLVRNGGVGFAYTGFLDDELTKILDSNYESFTDWNTQYQSCLTADHDTIHSFVGGNMADGDLSCVVADPVSWFLHAFIDLMWEEYRVKIQTTDKETDYPDYTTSENEKMKYHAATQMMRPFYNLYNIDGFSEDYFEYFYGYQNRKLTCESSTDCGNTEFTYCDTEEGRCSSKIKQDGDCTQEGTDEACLSGSCAEEDENGKRSCVGEDAQ